MTGNGKKGVKIRGLFADRICNQPKLYFLSMTDEGTKAPKPAEEDE